MSEYKVIDNGFPVTLPDGYVTFKKYYKNGSLWFQNWFRDGAYHRVDAPASIECYENGKIHIEEWYLDGKRHRVGAPAEIEYNSRGEIVGTAWWYYGHPVTNALQMAKIKWKNP